MYPIAQTTALRCDGGGWATWATNECLMSMKALAKQVAAVMAVGKHLTARQSLPRYVCKRLWIATRQSILPVRNLPQTSPLSHPPPIDCGPLLVHHDVYGQPIITSTTTALPTISYWFHVSCMGFSPAILTRMPSEVSAARCLPDIWSSCVYHSSDGLIQALDGARCATIQTLGPRGPHPLVVPSTSAPGTDHNQKSVICPTVASSCSR
jgi:hypothetical protein